MCMYAISVSTVKTSCVKYAKMVSIACDNKAIPKLFYYLMTQSVTSVTETNTMWLQNNTDCTKETEHRKQRE